MILFENRTENGVSQAQRWYGGVAPMPHGYARHAHGPGTFVAWGSFDGAGVELEISPDQGQTWLSLEGSTLQAPGSLNFDLGVCQLRARLSNAGAGTSVSARILV